MKTPLFETFVRDVRVALRALLKSPGFAGVVVISLALGIAANSTIYSVVVRQIVVFCIKRISSCLAHALRFGVAG